MTFNAVVSVPCENSLPSQQLVLCHVSINNHHCSWCCAMLEFKIFTAVGSVPCENL